MATVEFAYVVGRNCYVQASQSGLRWNGVAFETFDAAHYATYSIAATGAGGIYTAPVPILPAGFYTFVAYERLGVAPILGDPPIASKSWQWSGAEIVWGRPTGVIKWSRQVIQSGQSFTLYRSTWTEIPAAAMIPEDVTAVDLRMYFALQQPAKSASIFTLTTTPSATGSVIADRSATGGYNIRISPEDGKALPVRSLVWEIYDEGSQKLLARGECDVSDTIRAHTP